MFSFGRALQNFKRIINPQNIVVRFNFYSAYSKDDTIFALATDINAYKGSPLGVIRISGKGAKEALQSLTNKYVLSNEHNKCPSISNNNLIKPRVATNVRIINRSNQQLIDLSIALWFPKPRSYTGQDVVELHVHGSQAIVTNILAILGSMDHFRPAEPGEFTKRALVNGKMSLDQVESVNELIAAKTNTQLKLALSALDGKTKIKYKMWADELTTILAHLEASIDFGEDEAFGEDAVISRCCERIEKLATEISEYILFNSYSNKILKNGIDVVILGPPNAGKSTLMNLLCQREKSIVSDLSGTTRDIIDHTFDLNGYAVKLCDTAGLHKIDLSQPEKSGIDLRHLKIEKEGIERAINVANHSDIVLYCIASDMLDKTFQDFKMQIVQNLKENLELTSLKNLRFMIVILNKIDSDPKFVDEFLQSPHYKTLVDDIKNHFNIPVLVNSLSCLTGQNYHDFITDLSTCFETIVKSPMIKQCKKIDDDEFFFVNQRHYTLLKKVTKNLQLASQIDTTNIEITAQLVREAVDYISRIGMDIDNEKVLDVIFKDFCIGK